MKKIILSVLIIIIFIALAFALYSNYVSMNNSPTSPRGDIEKVSSRPSIEAVEILATNLEIPWSLVFLPNAEILFTQRPGILSLLSSGQVIEIAQISDVKTIGEGGLMGLELHPEFENNNYIYIMYTYSSDGDDTLNRVIRYEYENRQISNPEIIVDEIPGARFHNGGRIKFGPDNYLYITTGDSQNPSLSQDRDSLAGKILRVTGDGFPAPGNPFNTRIYSYGHRNPQGITWDSEENLYSTEHGRSNPTGYDEVNLIEAGRNYGWPEIEGNETRNDMITPIANSGLGTWAPGSAAYLNDSLFFGGLRPKTLFELKLKNNTPTLVEHFTNEFGRIRDVIVGPDNMLYITTSNRDGRGDPVEQDDRIIRINPEKL
jgi:aldose sugar dehydrogenase